MGRLIKAELLKLSKSVGYKVLLLSLVGSSVLFGLLIVSSKNRIEGQEMYLQAIKDILLSEIFISIFTSVFICYEFSNRTFNIGIMSGCKRLNLLLSKAVAYIAGAIPLALAYPITTSFIMTLNNGFGETNPEIWEKLFVITFLYIVGIVALGSFCLMLTMLIKNNSGTIGICIGLTLFLTVLAQNNLLSPIMRFTFQYQLMQILELESLTLYGIVIVLTIIVSLVISAFIFKKSELK